MGATKRHRRELTGWAGASRPVTCAEFAAAMLRAGQTRREVVERLEGLGRWRPGHVRWRAYEEARRLGLLFAYGGGRYVEKPRSDGLHARARDALAGQPEERRREYRALKRYGVGTLEALRAMGL